MQKFLTICSPEISSQVLPSIWMTESDILKTAYVGDMYFLYHLEVLKYQNNYWVCIANSFVSRISPESSPGHLNSTKNLLFIMTS